MAGATRGTKYTKRDVTITPLEWALAGVVFEYAWSYTSGRPWVGQGSANGTTRVLVQDSGTPTTCCPVAFLGDIRAHEQRGVDSPGFILRSGLPVAFHRFLATLTGDKVLVSPGMDDPYGFKEAKRRVTIGAYDYTKKVRDFALNQIDEGKVSLANLGRAVEDFFGQPEAGLWIDQSIDWLINDKHGRAYLWRKSASLMPAQRVAIMCRVWSEAEAYTYEPQFIFERFPVYREKAIEMIQGRTIKGPVEYQEQAVNIQSCPVIYPPGVALNPASL